MRSFLVFLCLVFVVPVSICSAQGVKEATKSAKSYQEIHTEELKKLVDQKKPMTIIDARIKYAGGRLPGAVLLPHTADENEIKKAIGSLPKETMIVVYCSNVKCPVSKYLAKRLVSLGYTNVYKYPEGVSGWLEKGYPTDQK